MLFACLIIAHAVVIQDPAPVEIQIRHMRASKALEIMEESNSRSLRPLGLDADDGKGCVIVQGNPDTVKQVRELAKLIDVARKRVSVKVTIDSEADKESYQVSTKIANLQQWKTGDGDTGITVAIQPRMSDGDTVTLLVVCGRDGSNSVQETIRMKLGSSHTFTMGSQISKVYRQQLDGTFHLKAAAVPEPKVTIRIDK